MAAIAAFAKSDQGQSYAAICHHWGVDPAAGFADDIVAVNLRAALFAASLPERTAVGADDWESAAAENKRLWLAGG